MAKRKRKNAKRQSLITALVVLVIAAGSFCYSYFMQNPSPVTEGVSQPQESEQLQVYFIDVGQGDSSLIVCGEHSVLIDAGEAEYANDVIRQIQDLGISRLDCIVSTHPHSDHAGGLPYVIETIGADMILMPGRWLRLTRRWKTPRPAMFTASAILCLPYIPRSLLRIRS